MSMRLIAIFIFIFLTYPILRGYRGSIKRNSTQRHVYILTFLILFCFASFRPIGIDQDSVGYQLYYNSGQLIWKLAEPTFGIISIIVNSLFSDFRFVLIIYAFIGLSLKFYILPKLSSTVWLCIILYFSTYFLLHEFTQIRAGVASGLFLISIYFLHKDKWKQYLFTIFIACLFHYSAIILFPIVFLKNVKLSKGWVFFLSMLIPIALGIRGLGSSLLISIPIDLIQSKVGIYMTEAENTKIALNIFNLIYLSKYLILYFFIFKYKKYQYNSEYFPLLLSIYAFSLFFYISLSWNTIFAMRISELLGVVEIILLPLLHKEFSQKFIGNLFIIGVAAMYLWANIYSLDLIYSSVKLQ